MLNNLTKVKINDWTDLSVFYKRSNRKNVRFRQAKKKHNNGFKSLKYPFLGSRYRHHFLTVYNRQIKTPLHFEASP